MPDGFLPNTGLGMQARETRAKAQAFLAHAAGAGKVEALAARVERFEAALAEKDQEIAELRAENSRLLRSGPAAKQHGTSASTRQLEDHARAGALAPPAEAEHSRPPASPRGAGGRFPRGAAARRTDPKAEDTGRADDVAGDVPAALAEAGGVPAGEDGDFV